jgi:hypothetical protein
MRSANLSYLLLVTSLAVRTPVTGRSAALFDMTGYWAATLTSKGNINNPPLNAEGRRISGGWDPAKHRAKGEQCKAYGAGGVMRLPGHLHITWENDNTLKIETDAGTQTRRFFFGGTQFFPTEATWQGHSLARWNTTGLAVTTTHLRPGYLQENGVPYSSSTVLNEDFVRHIDKGQEYLSVTITVDDPLYLQQKYTATYEFKKQPDAIGWNPTPCSAN